MEMDDQGMKTGNSDNERVENHTIRMDPINISGSFTNKQDASTNNPLKKIVRLSHQS